MPLSEIPSAALQGLRSRRAGFVVASGEDGWDAARQAFNLICDQRPELVARPETADDVVEAIRFARDNGLRVAPQSTGHAADGIGSLEGAVLLRTDAMRDVEVDLDARRVRFAAGARWRDVTPLTSPSRLAPLSGSSPGVGVVGYTLGGGLSFLGRRHGLAASHAIAFEVVTADGRKLRVDADSEPDLFWALRGGGGSFAVVTALELGLVEVPELYLGAMFFPVERSGEVMHAYRELTAGSPPEDLTLVARFLQIPDVEGPPPPLRGRSFAVVEAVYTGSEGQGAELLAPLRSLEPEIDTVAVGEPSALGELHMDPPEPVPAMTGHMLLDALPAQGVDALVAAAGPGSGSPLLSVELRHLEGALARPAADPGALAAVPGRYLMFAVGAVMDPALGPPIAQHLQRLRAALAPYDAGLLTNFAEGPVEASDLFDADTLARLSAIRAEWDPDGLFQANNPVR